MNPILVQIMPIRARMGNGITYFVTHSPHPALRAVQVRAPHVPVQRPVIVLLLGQAEVSPG